MSTPSDSANPDTWWFQASAELLKTNSVQPATKFVWLALCSFRNHVSNEAYPCLRTLCKMTGYGKDKVRAAIKELCEIGLILSATPKRSGSHWVGVSYILAEPKVERTCIRRLISGVGYQASDRGTKLDKGETRPTGTRENGNYTGPIASDDRLPEAEIKPSPRSNGLEDRSNGVVPPDETELQELLDEAGQFEDQVSRSYHNARSWAASHENAMKKARGLLDHLHECRTLTAARVARFTGT